MPRGRLLSTVLLLALPVPAAAQLAPHSYVIGARIGIASFDKASGIDRGTMIGLDGTYFFSPHIGVGFSLDVSRPQTKGEFFPFEFTLADTTFLYAVRQPLTIAQVGGQVVLRQPMGSLVPYVMAGAGWYRYTLDPQVSNGPKSFTHPMYMLGGGVNIRFSDATGIRFEVRDIVQTSFDRNALNPVAAPLAPVRFPDFFAPPPAAKNTAHSFQLALAFSFVPGGGQ
jgi:hypothetical protein